MSFDITMLVIDTDEAYECKLFLPGEPVEFGMGEGLCSICDEYVDAYEDGRGFLHRHDSGNGEHQGIVEIWYSPVPDCEPAAMEYNHLRCALAVCTDMKSSAIIIGDPEIAGEIKYPPKHLKETV